MAARFPMPTKEQIEAIKNKRRVALLKKHTEGKRLTPEEREEIADLLSAPQDVSSTRSFESMAAAAKFIGGSCDINLLKAAKKAGCPAFRCGRIYAKELMEWLKDNPVTSESIQSKEGLQIRKLQLECERLQRENLAEACKLISVEENQAINARVDAAIWRAVDETFGDAWKQSMVGVSTFAQVSELTEKAKDQIRELIYAPARESEA